MARGGAAEALDGVLYLARYHPELVEIKYPTCCRTKLRMVPLLCHCSRPPIFSSRSLLVRADIQPGATFPDYELTDQTGRKQRLSELQRDNPMILLLSRGHF